MSTKKSRPISLSELGSALDAAESTDVGAKDQTDEQEQDQTSNSIGAVPEDMLRDLLQIGKPVAKPTEENPSAEAEVVTSDPTIDIPPTLNFRTEVKNSLNGSVLELQLFGSGCLECSHLIPDAPERYAECHFRQGNAYCPAGYHRIVFIGDFITHVNRIKRAQAQGDTNRLLSALKKLESEPLDLKKRVLAEVGMLPTPTN